MSDEAAGPPEYPTAQLPVADKNEILLRELKVLVTSVGSAVVRIEADMGRMRNDVGELQDWKALIEGRLQNNSVRAKSQSDADLTHDAAIANVVARVASIETKTDALDAKQDVQTALLTEARDLAKKVWANPKTTILVGALWTLLVGWLARKGIILP